MEEQMGLYIHIPFCNRKCDYCDFVSYSMDKKAQQLYLEGLFCEIDSLKQKFESKTFNSIYIGGGTPSIVFEGFIAALSRKVFSSFHFDQNTEFTIEVNPASFNKTKFFEYVEAGVNRISVGVQCIDTKLLKKHGRIQDIDNIKDTFTILRNSKFPNVSGDVLIGLPGQTKKSVIKTVKFLIDNKVKHISTYSLQIEKHTMLFDNIRSGKLKPMSEEKTLSLYNIVYKMLDKNGFKRYEVSNFARAGYESRHNQKYWNNTQYLGLGVSSHSYINNYRYYNTKRLDTYLDKVNNNKSPIYKTEFVGLNERRTERIMLSLRTAKGLNLAEFKKEFKEDLLLTKTKEINKLISLNMITNKDGYLKITEQYFNVSNSIIVELI